MSAHRTQRGFTLIESVVVAVLVSITVFVAVSLVNERLRTARIRVAVKQFAVDLRLARLNAVAQRTPVSVVVSPDPANRYQFTDPQGQTRTVRLPRGVRITGSTTPIVFRANGSVPGGASTVLETAVTSRIVERYTVQTGLLGVPRIAHERGQP